MTGCRSYHGRCCGRLVLAARRGGRGVTAVRPGGTLPLLDEDLGVVAVDALRSRGPTGNPVDSVAMVGDSITVGRLRAVLEQFATLGVDHEAIDAVSKRVRHVGATSIPAGGEVAVSESAGEEVAAADLWVIALGTNDDRSPRLRAAPTSSPRHSTRCSIAVAAERLVSAGSTPTTATRREGGRASTGPSPSRTAVAGHHCRWGAGRCSLRDDVVRSLDGVQPTRERQRVFAGVVGATIDVLSWCLGGGRRARAFSSWSGYVPQRDWPKR